jgi:hypothetical protein
MKSDRPAYQLSDILRSSDLPSITPNGWKLRTLFAISKCRTAGLGGHIDRCTHRDCGKLHLSYNSCRNRHCPKCQGHQREVWIQKRESELLNVPYFHVVFTLPDHLNELCLHKPEVLYSILFKTAWEVIKGFGANPKFLGARTGMISVLHTWGSNMSLHPHLHCIVPAGGINAAGNWKSTKTQGKYLFPVKSMSKVFRAKFLDALNKADFLTTSLHQKLTSKPWVVYAKRPFAGPQRVIEYLGRYTHKIAISNHRITDVGQDTVSFSVKDYRQGGKKGICQLSKREFIRRFTMHILPKGFTRIRHYGILSSTGKRNLLPAIREETGKVTLAIKRNPIQQGLCPFCKVGKLETIAIFRDRGPPRHLIDQIANQDKQRQRA